MRRGCKQRRPYLPPTSCRQASRTSARSSTTHQPPSPTAPAYPPIASPSHVKMSLLGRKFPAQIGTSNRAARRSAIEAETQLTDVRLQRSPCGPSTSPVCRERQLRIPEKEDCEGRWTRSIGQCRKGEERLSDNVNETLQALSSSTVSTLPPTPWARVSSPLHQTAYLTRIDRADSY